jgi:hypothetical protein
MTESKISLFTNKGFHLNFENGMTISVIFGESSYSHRIESAKPDLSESFNAEIAIWNKDGEWFNFGYDEVKGYCSSDEIAEWIYIVKNSNTFDEITEKVKLNSIIKNG